MTRGDADRGRGPGVGSEPDDAADDLAPTGTAPESAIEEHADADIAPERGAPAAPEIATPEIAAPETNVASRPAETGGEARRWSWQLAALVILAALPALRMANVVRQATLTQYSDYWPMFPTVFQGDGSLSWRGIFEFRNVHSLVTAKVLYWLNYKVSGGSNVTLGYIVVAVVVIQIVLLVRLVRRSDDQAFWVKGALVVAASVLMFARHGTWNFVHSMSGAAWLTANLFVLAAIVVDGVGWKRRSGAVALGLAATLSYGTGLMVWPALMVAAVVRDRRVWRHWAIAVGGAAGLAWYQYQPLAQGTVRHGGERVFDLENFLAIMGGSVARGSAGAAQVVAALVLVVGVVAGIFAARRASSHAAPWLGLLTYGAFASLFISMGRHFAAEDLVQIGRYSSLGAYAMIGALALVLALVPRLAWKQWTAIGVVAVASLIVWQGDANEVRVQLASGSRWDELAIAQRLHLADGSRRWLYLDRMPHISRQMERMGHYPFNDDFTFGCGLLGEPFGEAPVAQDLPKGVVGHVNPGRTTESLPGAWSTSGWFSKPLDCVLVTDPDGLVVGVGSTWKSDRAKYLRSSPSAQQFALFARVGDDPTHVLVKVADTGQWIELHTIDWYQQRR